MKLNKLLIASTVALPAAITPLGVMTSCSNSWGFKTPLAIGSIDKNNQNNPYYQFYGQAYNDLDNRNICEYLPSNYIYDLQANATYAYSTPIDKWYETKDNKSRKLSIDQWTNGTSGWYTSSAAFSTTFTENDKEVGDKKYNVTQTNNQNVTLIANTSFVTSIAQFINKYTTYALNYATSQVHDAQDFAIAWGGSTPTTTDSTKRALYEWMFANSNAHATGSTNAYLKTTSANFNFLNFPIPSYTKKDNKMEASEATKELLTGSKTGSLSSEDKPIYWSNKQEQGSGSDKYTVYTYPAVPVVVKATNLTQRYIDPTKHDSIYVTEYYQNNKDEVTKQVGNSWALDKLFTSEEVTAWKEAHKKQGQEAKDVNFNAPSIYKFTAKTNGKSVKFDTGREDKVDTRIKNVDGSDFIALITYNYIDWGENADPELNRNNSVQLSSLQTVIPAYLLTKPDLFVKAKSDKDNSGYIIDVNKADSYSTELINLLSRNSSEGRVAKASNLNDTSKEYLHFLNYLFGTDESYAISDFLTATEW